jgi:hypothetical protein
VVFGAKSRELTLELRGAKEKSQFLLSPWASRLTRMNIIHPTTTRFSVFSLRRAILFVFVSTEKNSSLSRGSASAWISGTIFNIKRSEICFGFVLILNGCTAERLMWGG